MQEWYEVIDNFSKFEKIESRLIFERKGDGEPEVTVAIPAYKRANLLRDAVKSVLGQKGEYTFELLIVDDYPFDDCEIEKLLKEIENDEHKIGIRYYRNKQNMGMGGNWNRCLELARGKWVILLHDDDMLCDNYIETVLPIAERTNCSLVGTFSYQMNLLERSAKDAFYTKKLARSKKVLCDLRKGRAFELKKEDLLHFIQPSPGCWMIHREKNIHLGGYDASRLKNGLIDGPFNFKNTYHEKTIIIPQFLFTRRIKENDFLNPEAQVEILCGLYEYIVHYAGNYGVLAKWTVDISILNFAKGMKAKYNAQINAKEILAEKGVNPVLLKCPNAIISLLNAMGLCKLIFRKRL